jgi:hypothetical protein
LLLLIRLPEAVVSEQPIFFVIILDDKNGRFLLTTPALSAGWEILWRQTVLALGKELRIRTTRFFLHLNQQKSSGLEKRNIFVERKRSFSLYTLFFLAQITLITLFKIIQMG